MSFVYSIMLINIIFVIFDLMLHVGMCLSVFSINRYFWSSSNYLFLSSVNLCLQPLNSPVFVIHCRPHFCFTLMFASSRLINILTILSWPFHNSRNGSHLQLICVGLFSHQYCFFRIIIYIHEMVLFLFLGTITITSTGTQIIGETLRLQCTLSPFTGTTSWAKDGIVRTTCTRTVCTDNSYGNYTTFSIGSNYVNVTFDPVHSSINGVWKCTHLTLGSARFNVNAMNETQYIH